MELGLMGRSAVVTGASQGIGRAIARRLALEGVTVVGAARRVSLIEALGLEVEAEGGASIHAERCDLSVPDAAEVLAVKAVERLGRPVDILVNVAGQSHPVAMDAAASAWAEAMQLGFLAPRQLTHLLLPAMRAQRWGRVITITGGSEPRFLSASTPAKAALHVWSKAVSREVAAEGVTSNCLQPGRIRSEQLMRRLGTVEAEQAFAKREIPAGRIGEADEIAAAAVFLASTQAAYVNGAVLPVDGGFRMYAF